MIRGGVKPTLLDTIEVTEENTDALTFSNIDKYLKMYNKLIVFGILPYTETNTDTAVVLINLSADAYISTGGLVAYASTKALGAQTTNRERRLYVELEQVMDYAEGKPYLMTKGIVSNSTSISPYTNAAASGCYPTPKNYSKKISKLHVVQSPCTWAVGTIIRLFGKN